MARLDLSYGDVTGEYLTLRRGAGYIAGLRESTAVTGPDAESFLQGILTQDVSGTQVRRSALLNPKGRVEALLWVAPRDDGYELISDAGFGSVVARSLARFRIRVDVEIAEPVDVLDVWGPEAGAVVDALADRRSAAIPLRRLPRFVVFGSTPDELEAAGARPVGTLALDAVRIEGGEPILGRDVDPGCLLHDTGLVSESVSFTKGCYLGQEIVARIEHRGRAVRTLRGLRMVENVLPPAGATVSVAGREVGAVGSVAESLELRCPVALAVVRTDVPVGVEVAVAWDGGTVAAELAELPLDDFTDL